MNWWDVEEGLEEELTDATPMVLERQAELFDDAGEAVYTPAVAEEGERAAATRMGVALAQPANGVLTLVSGLVAGRGEAKAVVTRRAKTASRATVVSQAQAAASNEVARHLVMSLSISSGKEQARRFSVPRRALLPRYQLFEGASSVVEESGQLHLCGREARKGRGHVWFV